MAKNYIMARYSAGNLIYTYEFIVIIIILIILLLFWKLNDDRNSLIVYVLTGIGDTIIELLASASGIRIVEETYLFGVFYVGFPLLPVIMGFFEGGVQCIIAYHLIQGIMLKNKLSLKFSLSYLIVTIIIMMFSRLSAFFNVSQNSIGITRRSIFSLGSILLLISCYLVSFGYFFLNKTINKRERISFLLWYLFIMIVYFPVFLISHITMTRFIEIEQNGTYEVAPLLEQILVLYGYGLVLEAGGFFLPYYVIIHHFHLIDLSD
ncbi:MAG: hypothetical protein ACFFDO_05630 [Candidatus Thorarchaeota archaeon]